MPDQTENPTEPGNASERPTEGRERVIFAPSTDYIYVHDHVNGWWEAWERADEGRDGVGLETVDLPKDAGPLFADHTAGPDLNAARLEAATQRASSWWEEAKRSRRSANEQKACADAAEAKLDELLGQRDVGELLRLKADLREARQDRDALILRSNGAARSLADLRDELATARQETERALELAEMRDKDRTDAYDERDAAQSLADERGRQLDEIRAVLADYAADGMPDDQLDRIRAILDREPGREEPCDPDYRDRIAEDFGRNACHEGPCGKPSGSVEAHAKPEPGSVAASNHWRAAYERVFAIGEERGRQLDEIRAVLARRPWKWGAYDAETLRLIRAIVEGGQECSGFEQPGHVPCKRPAGHQGDHWGRADGPVSPYVRQEECGDVLDYGVDCQLAPGHDGKHRFETSW